MWERFTKKAQRVVFYAQQEAGRLGENHVSTEHLLLGLVAPQGAAAPVGSVWPPPPSSLPPIDARRRGTDHKAAAVLRVLGISLADVCVGVERRLKIGPGPNGCDMQLTPRGKRVMDLACDEAKRLNHSHIGTEHLLLGLIREEGMAGQVLAELGVTLERARQEVVNLQHGSVLPAPASPPKRPWWRPFG